MGTPDEFSADEYENFLLLIKNMLAKSDKPLQQIVKRLNELMLNGLLFPQEDEDDAFITTAQEHCDGPTIGEGQQFAKANFGHWQLTTKAPNNYVIMKDETIVLIKNFVRTSTGLFMVGQSFDPDDIIDFFNVPLPSTSLGIYDVDNIFPHLSLFPMTDMKKKCIKIPDLDNRYVVITMD